MTRRSLAASVSVLAVAVLLGACGEPARAPTQSRVLASQQSSPTSCSFSSMNPDIAQFFSSSSQQKTVKGLQSTMQTAWSAGDTTGARNAGYDIFSQMDTAVQNGAVGSVSNGSSLVNEVSACMFWDANQLPADFPHDYTTELTPTSQGAFSVRGGPSDATSPVLSRGSPIVSGIAPQQGSTWSQTVSGVVTPSRVLFYGQPSTTTPDAYDWKAIPANATFDPRLVVGVCDPGSTYLIYESDADILPYVSPQSAPFLTLLSCQASASNSLVQRVFAMGKHMAAMLLPPSAHATTMVLSGLGGTSSGFSTFSPYNVGTVAVTFTTQPHDATVLPSSTCPTTPIGDPYNVGPVTFQVTKNGIAVGGTAITITQVNNNGTPTTVCGNTSGVTDANGNLTLNGIGLTKTGAYVFIASGAVPGRTITSNAAASNKFNIRP